MKVIIDKNLELSLAQAVTDSAASTNYIDQGAAGDALYNELFAVCRVDTTCTSAASSATVVVKIETCAEPTFSAPTVLLTSPSHGISASDLIAGQVIVKSRLPLGALRYIRGYYTVSTQDFTAGKFDLSFVKDINTAFPA